MAILWWRPSRGISSFRSSENDTLSFQIIQTLPIYTFFVKKRKKTFFCLLMFWRRLVLHMWPWVFPLPRYRCSWGDGAGRQATLQPLGRAGLEFALLAVKMSKFAFGQTGAGGIYSSIFWMWATPFPERHHTTCTVCDESNLVLYPDSCWCVPSTRYNVPSLEHTGTFSGDP